MCLAGVQPQLVAQVAAAARGPVILVQLAHKPSHTHMNAGADGRWPHRRHCFPRQPQGKLLLCLCVLIDCVCVQIHAILWVGYPGQSGGQAIAETIFGDNNPGGHLPMTVYPESFSSVSMFDMAMRPSGAYPGRTYRFYTGLFVSCVLLGLRCVVAGRPVFEFGFGLSYTTFRLEPLTAKSLTAAEVSLLLSCADVCRQIGTAPMRIKVTNTGNVRGDAVVFAYSVPPSPGKVAFALHTRVNVVCVRRMELR